MFAYVNFNTSGKKKNLRSRIVEVSNIDFPYEV